MYNTKKILLLIAIFLPCFIFPGSGGSKSANITTTKIKTPSIFFQNNKWYVYIPSSGKTHCFSSTQMAKIIENMPSDMKSSVLCDAKNLDRIYDFIEKNNITPEIVPNADCSDNFKSPVSYSWQAIMDRARSYHSTIDREKYMRTISDFSTDRVFRLYYKADKQGLENMRAETIKERNKYSSTDIKAKMLERLLVQIDQASRCPRFEALYFIKYANLDAAIYKYQDLIGRMPREILEAAEKILKARTDYQERLVHNVLKSYQDVYQPTFLEVQPMIVEVLNPSHDLSMVAQKMGVVVDQVFANADKYNYMIPYEIDLEIQSSLDILPGIKNAKEFTFEIAKIQHILCDVQEQTIEYADLKSSIIERSPDLLTRAMRWTPNLGEFRGVNLDSFCLITFHIFQFSFSI